MESLYPTHNRTKTKLIYVRSAGMAPDAHCSLIISHPFKSQCSLPGLIIIPGQIQQSSINIFPTGMILNRPSVLDGEGKNLCKQRSSIRNT